MSGFKTKISQEEVDRLINVARKSQKPTRIDWPAKREYPNILKALKAGADSIVIEGKDFIIRWRDSERCFIKPITGFVPCGEFSLEGAQKEVDALEQDT